MIFLFIILCFIIYIIYYYYFYKQQQCNTLFCDDFKLFNLNYFIDKHIWIIGFSGSGKSSLSLILKHILGVPCLHMDEVRFKDCEGFNVKSSQDMINIINTFLQSNKSNGWIIESTSRKIDHIIDPNVDIIIYLNMPFYISLYRVIKRSIIRCYTGQQLFNSQNREYFSNFLKVWDSNSMIYWTIFHFNRNKKIYINKYKQHCKLYPDTKHFIISSPNHLNHLLNEFSSQYSSKDLKKYIDSSK